MREFHAEQPALEEWREGVIADIAGSISIVEVVKQNLSPIDILFIVLGVSSAFGLVSRRTRQEQTDARREARSRAS